MIRVLLVEDQESIALPLAFLLRKEGFEVTPIGDGAAALREFTTNPYDFVLLDLMLPSVNGIDICQHIRKHSDVPIIMLTAKNAEVDKIVGLESGADDYVTKPYSARELIARMRAVMRRRGVMPSGLAQLAQDGVDHQGAGIPRTQGARLSGAAADEGFIGSHPQFRPEAQQDSGYTSDDFGASSTSGGDPSWSLEQYGMDGTSGVPFLAAEVDAFRQTIQSPHQQAGREGSFDGSAASFRDTGSTSGVHSTGSTSSSRDTDPTPHLRGAGRAREGVFSPANLWGDTATQEHTWHGGVDGFGDDIAFGDHAVLVGGRITLDTAKHEVTVDGELIQMPLKEFELLELFLRNQEIVLTRQVLIERVWGANYVGDTKTLDVHVKRIRSKIEREPKRPQQLLTVRGLGYRFVPEAD